MYFLSMINVTNIGLNRFLGGPMQDKMVKIPLGIEYEGKGQNFGTLQSKPSMCLLIWMGHEL